MCAVELMGHLGRETPSEQFGAFLYALINLVGFRKTITLPASLRLRQE